MNKDLKSKTYAQLEQTIVYRTGQDHRSVKPDKIFGAQIRLALLCFVVRLRRLDLCFLDEGQRVEYDLFPFLESRLDDNEHIAAIAELERTAQVLKGFLGDRESYAAFDFPKDLSWQVGPTRPVSINPAGATKNGLTIDGALTEEMRRGCPFQIPPCPTAYPWEGLQGIIVDAMILYRRGYDVWNWEE